MWEPISGNYVISGWSYFHAVYNNNVDKGCSFRQYMMVIVWEFIEKSALHSLQIPHTRQRKFELCKTAQPCQQQASCCLKWRNYCYTNRNFNCDHGRHCVKELSLLSSFQQHAGRGHDTVHWVVLDCPNVRVISYQWRFWAYGLLQRNTVTLRHTPEPLWHRGQMPIYLRKWLWIISAGVLKWTETKKKTVSQVSIAS